MPWFPYPRQAVDGVLTLEACRFARAASVFDGRCPVEPLSIRTTLSPCSRLWLASRFGSRVCERGCRVRGLDLRTGPLVMSIGWDTPYRHPRQ